MLIWHLTTFCKYQAIMSTLHTFFFLSLLAMTPLNTTATTAQSISTTSENVQQPAPSNANAKLQNKTLYSDDKHINGDGVGGSGGWRYSWGWGAGGGGGGGVGGGRGAGRGGGSSKEGGGRGGGGGRSGGGGGNGGGWGWGWGGGGRGGGQGWWKWGCHGGSGHHHQPHWKREFGSEYYKLGEFAECMVEGQCHGMRLDCPHHCGGPCFYDCHHQCTAHCQN
ncbi:hypothetical protein Ancab_028978 [Ancistrocladus abbreviatus]